MVDLSRCTVLLVDDDEENVDVLVETLGAEVDITVALDGETALEIVEEEKPDLILLDVEMPGMDGYEVCRRLKADPASADIPVIFLSGRTEAADKAHGLALGAVEFIHKPFMAPEVLAQVRDVLGYQPCSKET